MKENKIIEGLNDLLKKNYDAERGYMNAAEKATSPTLVSFFKNKASNRNTYGHQIKDILREMEGEIDKGTSIKGDIHNAWINFRVMISFDKEEVILDEVERGEEVCVKEYDDFLSNTELPHSIRRIISYQRNNIAGALDKVERLEDQY